jgi:dTDP-4-amino-4,6-dideoxygalactose transaminase
VHYPEPIHLQPGWRWLGYGPGSFPVAESLARRQLSLPMFAGITDAQVDAVCAALAEVMEAENEIKEAQA